MYLNGFSLFVLLNFLCGQLFAQNVLTAKWIDVLGNQFNEGGMDMEYSDSGYVYICGNFIGTLDMDPGVNVWNISSTGLNDHFCAKYDSSGHLVWARAFQGTGNNFANALTVDHWGNVTITGYSEDSLDADPSPSSQYWICTNRSSAFDIHLDANGHFLWATDVNSYWPIEYGKDVCHDEFGNVFTIYKVDSLFEPSSPQTSKPIRFLITKYNQSGNLLWYEFFYGAPACITYRNNKVYYVIEEDTPRHFICRSTFGNILWRKSYDSSRYSNIIVHGITTDLNENIYTTGHYHDTVDFDYGITNSISISNGNMPDIFVMKMDNLGQYAWHKTFGSIGVDEGLDIIAPDGNHIIATGYFSNTVDFDPGPGLALKYAPYSQPHIFLLELKSSNGALERINTMGGGGADKGIAIEKSPGGALYSLCTFMGTADLNPSMITNNYNATAWSNDFAMVKLVECSPEYHNDTLHITACNSYTSPGGNTYYGSGYFPEAMPNQYGCDSTYVLHLTLNWMYMFVSQSGNTLMANPINGTYQWVDCLNNYSPIPGETNSTFTPTYNSSFACIMNENGCVDTSICLSAFPLDIEDEIKKDERKIKIYPNPGPGNFTVELNRECKSLQLEIYNQQGQVVSKGNLQQVKTFQWEFQGASGIYFLKLKTNEYILNEKLLIR